MEVDTIEVFRNWRRRWTWRIRHSNGEILAHSESYSNKGACMDTVNGFVHRHPCFIIKEV